MKIKKGDSVKVMTGNDKNKIGRVLKVYPKKDRILVEGVNMVKKHTRPTQDNPQGGILEKESTMNLKKESLM